MNKRPKLAIDLDGVLADYTSVVIPRLCALEGIPVPDNFSPKRWFWYDQLGVQKTTVNKLWDEIKQSEDFWATLPALPYTSQDCQNLAKLEALDTEIYFLTNRPSEKNTKRQSETWLMTQGIVHPTVVLCSSKGPVCNSIGITHFIDDRWENISDVLRSCGVRTKCYVYSQPYNEAFNDIYIHRVATVTEMLQKEGLV
jgi:5'(3')-deoxyribonucleotidase